MSLRSDIVSGVLALVPQAITVHEAEQRWFYDLRRQGGMRLTKSGFESFTAAGFASWPVPIDRKLLTKRNVLEMNRRIQWPYYIKIKPPEIWLFSDREAVLASLYGDLEHWLNSLVDQKIKD